MRLQLELLQPVFDPRIHCSCWAARSPRYRGLCSWAAGSLRHLSFVLSAVVSVPPSLGGVSVASPTEGDLALPYFSYPDLTEGCSYPCAPVYRSGPSSGWMSDTGTSRKSLLSVSPRMISTFSSPCPPKVALSTMRFVSMWQGGVAMYGLQALSSVFLVNGASAEKKIDPALIVGTSKQGRPCSARIILPLPSHLTRP